VVRFSLLFKSETFELLKKYKPKTAANLSDIVKINFEDAMSQADQAIVGHEWDRAITLLKQAVRQAEATKDIDNTNLARYNMTFCLYMNKQYCDVLVLT
jgi:cellulose synthase operon protein C